ncbi:DNA polymerase III subunit delta' [Hydrogenobaculum acidophilum]
MNAKEFLEKVQLNQKIPTSTLIVSTKKDIDSLALSFAKGILCEKKIPWGCGECYSCKIFYDKHPDFIWIGRENSIKIDDIRELSNFAILKPNYSDYKVCLIANAQNMLKEASNALLKTLEEPPIYLKFIITADSLSNIIPTIVSRSIVLEIFERKTSKHHICTKLFSKSFYETIPQIDNIKDIKEKEEIIDCLIENLENLMLNKGFDESIENAIKSLNSTKKALQRGIRLGLWLLSILSPIIDQYV